MRRGGEIGRERESACVHIYVCMSVCEGGRNRNRNRKEEKQNKTEKQS